MKAVKAKFGVHKRLQRIADDLVKDGMTRQEALSMLSVVLVSIAIDHGVTQAFDATNRAVDKLDKEVSDKLDKQARRAK